MRTGRAEYWVIGACTGVALALRLYQLARPGYLLGVTEFDDGVLFGNAVRLAGGVIPYRDFAMEQPPGSLLLLAPVALVAKVTGTAVGLAIARMLTVAADCACVVLLGLLVRHRGPLAVAVACGGYAICPDAVLASHTFLLEPWLNVCCLAGAVLFFDGDALTTRPRRLAWGGALFGFAAAVKLWPLFPLAVAGLLLARRPRSLLIASAGAAAGLAVPVLPFLAVAPGQLFTGSVASQFVRSSGPHALLPRLASIAGLSGALTARTTATLLVVLAAWCVLGYLAAIAISRRRPAELDWYALLGLAAVVVMFCLPQGYYPHYGAFAGPFAALVLAGPAGLVWPVMRGPRPHVALGAVAAFGLAAAVAVAVTGLSQLHGESGLTASSPAATADRLIPPGACVVTDDTSLTIAADRFDSGAPGCPAVVDSFGTLMTMTGGHNMSATPRVLAAVVAAWRGWFGHAAYIWLLWGSQGRIPWAPSLYDWFTSHFRLIGLASTVPPDRGVPRGGLYARMPYDQQNDGHVAHQPVSARRGRS